MWDGAAAPGPDRAPAGRRHWPGSGRCPPVRWRSCTPWWLRSNSAAWRSFMIERASSAVCCGCRTWLRRGTMLPSILIAGGKPAVMKRSEPFFCEHQPQKVVHEFECLVASHGLRAPPGTGWWTPIRREAALVGALHARFGGRTRRCAAPGRRGTGRASACRYFWPVWIAEYICAILFSRIRLRIAGVPIMISCAAIRPSPSLVLSSVCEITRAATRKASSAPFPSRRPGTRQPRGRSSWPPSEVCRVPNTRWPVSAAVSARRMVSRSRISPTRITSGSSRSAERRALENDSVCGPTSRWLIRHFFDSWTNSIGSSTVRMCAVVVLVDVIDHRRQRRRLAGTRSAR